MTIAYEGRSWHFSPFAFPGRSMGSLDNGPPRIWAALRVLVVDDNVDGAEALCTLLASLGCATAVAFDGPQGLAAAAAFEPHLALIDLEMPGMSGCDVARRLRADQTPNSTRLVCLTGRGQPDDRRLCIEAGFDDFFTKPMLPERLSELVAAANDGLMRHPEASKTFAVQELSVPMARRREP